MIAIHRRAWLALCLLGSAGCLAGSPYDGLPCRDPSSRVPGLSSIAGEEEQLTWIESAARCGHVETVFLNNVGRVVTDLSIMSEFESIGELSLSNVPFLESFRGLENLTSLPVLKLYNLPALMDTSALGATDLCRVELVRSISDHENDRMIDGNIPIGALLTLRRQSQCRSIRIGWQETSDNFFPIVPGGECDATKPCIPELDWDDVMVAGGCVACVDESACGPTDPVICVPETPVYW